MIVNSTKEVIKMKMNMPGFTAAESLYRCSGYRHGQFAALQSNTFTPAAPLTGSRRGSGAGSGAGSGTKRCVLIPIVTIAEIDCGDAPCPANPGVTMTIEYEERCWRE